MEITSSTSSVTCVFLQIENCTRRTIELMLQEMTEKKKLKKKNKTSIYLIRD